MTVESFLYGRVTLHVGDCLDVLRTVADASVDAVVTDPPYHLTTGKKGGTGAASLNPNSTAGRSRIGTGFMGKAWDGGDIAFRVELWAEVLRVLKPGGHVVAFSGTRTYHRMACAIEDAGFEIRDQLAWTYATGFPKSHDVSKAIDRAAGAEREVIGSKLGLPGYRSGPTGDNAVYGDGLANGEAKCIITAPATDFAREWQGWGTALKPAWEPICLARKPLGGTVAENVLAHGVGALNINGCRIATDDDLRAGASKLWSHYREGEASAERRYQDEGGTNFAMKPGPRGGDPSGRWPANILHDGSNEVLAEFPDSKGQQGDVRGTEPSSLTNNCYGQFGGRPATQARGDSGSAARFFFSAKADADDRIGSKHPTVKPVDLMQWLVRLIAPKGATVLDMFAGTGTTGEAAWREGCRAILIEREEEYAADIRRRMEWALAGPDERRRKRAAMSPRDEAFGLFGGAL